VRDRSRSPRHPDVSVCIVPCANRCSARTRHDVGTRWVGAVKVLAAPDLVCPWLEMDVSPAARLLRFGAAPEQIGVVERERSARRPPGTSPGVVSWYADGFTRRHDLGAALCDGSRAGNRDQRDGDVALEDRRASPHDVQARPIARRQLPRPAGRRARRDTDR
jgi:hypothetical protein